MSGPPLPPSTHCALLPLPLLCCKGSQPQPLAPIASRPGHPSTLSSPPPFLTWEAFTPHGQPLCTPPPPDPGAPWSSPKYPGGASRTHQSSPHSPTSGPLTPLPLPSLSRGCPPPPPPSPSCPARVEEPSRRHPPRDFRPPPSHSPTPALPHFLLPLPSPHRPRPRHPPFPLPSLRLGPSASRPASSALYLSPAARVTCCHLSPRVSQMSQFPSPSLPHLLIPSPANSPQPKELLTYLISYLPYSIYLIPLPCLVITFSCFAIPLPCLAALPPSALPTCALPIVLAFACASFPSSTSLTPMAPHPTSPCIGPPLP